MLLKYSLLLLTLILFGCDNKMPSSAEQLNKEVHTEIGILNKLISLPAEPLSVKWDIDESKQSGNGSIRALLEFSEKDKQNILDKSSAFDKKSNDRIDAVFFDTWLTVEAKEGIEVKKVNGVYELVGVMALKPNLFTQTKLSPYVNGSVTPLAGGFILVSLYSM